MQLAPLSLCVCETWLKADRMPVFVNYTLYVKNRFNGNGGGIAILARNDICVSELQLDPYTEGLLEIQAVTIHLQKQKINIFNIYNPSKVITSEEFKHYFEQASPSKIIVGDFNAHHSLWSTNGKSSVTGNNLVKAILENNLCLLTQRGLQTYFHVPTASFSTLDLSFASGDLFLLASVSRLEDLGSDHWPVLVKLNIKPNDKPISTRPRWKLTDDGWKK